MQRSADGALAASALALGFCALFFSGGSEDAPLVWIGGLGLLAGAVAVAAVLLGRTPSPALGRGGWTFLACLGGLAVWMGVSVLWSIQPEQSWRYTNRTLAYVAFAVLGVLAARVGTRAVAAALAALLALVFAWALLGKVVPALGPDQSRVARLQSPLGYWNQLALLGDVAVPLALWLVRDPRRRAAGCVLLFLAGISILLTYSRFGIALALVAAAAWVLLERDRGVAVLAVALGGGAAVAVFAVTAALPGVTDAGVRHATRVHDGVIFGFALAVGLALAGAGGRRLRVAARVERLVVRTATVVSLLAVAAVLVVTAVRAGTLWRDFTSSGNVTNEAPRLASLASSNRWTWWQSAWHSFVHHPLGGTGAGTFELANRLREAPPTIEPHNTPLQFLAETGIVGFLLYAGAAAGAGVALVRRARDDAAGAALAVALAAWLVHQAVDMDWSYAGTTAPLLLVAGASVAGAPVASHVVERRRPLLAIGGVAFALVAVYSLAAPWIASRKLDASTSAIGRGDVSRALADAAGAHTYDPLSLPALLQWADLADLDGDGARARRLYSDAVTLEPLNPEPWFQLGVFEYRHRHWYPAYRALDRSWGLDPLGPAGEPCGYLDWARRLALRYGKRCPAPGPPGTPRGLGS